MLKFIVDTQLPPLLADFLCRKRNDAIHTTSFPDGHLMQDKEIIDIAIQQERIIITKDNDFFDYYFLKGSPPKILFLKLGNIKNNTLLSLFENNIEKLLKLYLENSNLVILERDSIIAY